MSELSAIRPKSTAHLTRGHFWSLPLSDGTFGAACVVGSCLRGGKRDTRLFIAGVVAWRGQNQPTSADLKNCPVVAHAFAHVKAIAVTGGSVVGPAEIDFGLLPDCAQSLSLPTWGYAMPQILAEQIAANGS